MCCFLLRKLTIAFIAFYCANLAPYAIAQGQRPPSGANESALLVALNEELHAVRIGRGNGRDHSAQLLESLAAIELPAEANERADLAQAWKLAAELIRQTEGTTPLLVEALQTASNLDPEDESLARELARQKRRQEVVSRRLERAAEVRSALREEAEEQR